jgi:hypothetical protein
MAAIFTVLTVTARLSPSHYVDEAESRGMPIADGQAASAPDKEAWLKVAEEWIKLAQSTEQRTGEPK